MRGRQRVEAILAANAGILDIRHHRSLRTTVWRLCRSAELIRAQPSIYISAGADDATRLRAIAVWCADATLVGAHAVAVIQNQRGPSELPTVVTETRKRARPGLVLQHRPNGIESRVVRGIRVASPGYLAVEAASTDEGGLMDTMTGRGVACREDYESALHAFRHRRGAGVRRRRVDESAARPFSVAERALHRLLRRSHLTDWVANRRLRVDGRMLVPDVRFQHQPLVLEVDGREYHNDPGSFENDRERQNHLVSAGFTVLRFTWSMLKRTPAAVIRTIRRTLAGLEGTWGRPHR